MKILLPVIILTFFLGACRKDKPTPTSIVFGQEEGLDYTKYYKLVEGNEFNTEYFDIDFDQDGLKDLRFIVGPSLDTSLSTVEARIESLHESCKVNVRHSIDTIFKFETYQANTDQNGNPIGIYSTTYSCKRESPLYEVDTVQNNVHIVLNNYNEILSVDDHFKSLVYVFNPANSNSFEPTGVVSQGVTFYDLITHINDCFEEPTQQESFVGVKLYTYEGVKLGYVRLGGLTSNRFIIKDWAIQP